ncbi:hypothetical protein KPSA1_05594 [Pseudomonas syringae pv. actinidiae]|uniref:Uncharacterized protein n=1 Tax=Pseudomonas syringae pv. actinidiae TaxID=103796 RepID=A0A2V0QU43_PSESF|nr:hypothetical protein KPSA1_05594 [Pseudomonas syringae pv. actinidiae]GBH19389.1 hypothetical protein KPSA3_05398 [Pseudomonas syringae pv. actinidiae]
MSVGRYRESSCSDAISIVTTDCNSVCPSLSCACLYQSRFVLVCFLTFRFGAFQLAD